nr:peroxidase 60-like [Tanacetum cinerariifolium]
MTQKEKKGMKIQKVVCLGGKLDGVAKTVENENEHQTRVNPMMMSTVGHLRNGVLDVKDLLKSSRDRGSSSRNGFGGGAFNDGLGGGYSSRWSVLQKIAIFPAVGAELLVAQEHAEKTGRRDGLVSLAQNTQSLPGPSVSVGSSIQAFARKGLNVTDMIYLLGGHTIGIAHCSLFQD